MSDYRKLDQVEARRRALVEGPENMSVGELNRALRILREEVHQQTIRAQDAEAEAERLKTVAPTPEPTQTTAEWLLTETIALMGAGSWTDAEDNAKSEALIPKLFALKAKVVAQTEPATTARMSADDWEEAVCTLRRMYGDPSPSVKAIVDEGRRARSAEVRLERLRSLDMGMFNEVRAAQLAAEKDRDYWRHTCTLQADEANEAKADRDRDQPTPIAFTKEWCMSAASSEGDSDPTTADCAHCEEHTRIRRSASMPAVERKCVHCGIGESVTKLLKDNTCVNSESCEARVLDDENIDLRLRAENAEHNVAALQAEVAALKAEQKRCATILDDALNNPTAERLLLAQRLIREDPEVT